MSSYDSTPNRFIGLDIHKKYFVATGVDRNLNQIYGPIEAPIRHLQRWAEKSLSKRDSIVVEMTTNTYLVYDTLLSYVHSVTVVHPPHVALIVRAQVKTDKKAALTLAQLHASGLLPGVWVPPLEVRELRALVAHRNKMVRLSSMAKCRLHSLVHRHGYELPSGIEMFKPEMRKYWEGLKVSTLERHCLLSDLDTLDFARHQIEQTETCLKEIAAKDDRMPILIQITGIGFLSATTILAAIGNIERFPTAKQLVGYAGLGARVHDSGMSYSTGRITKSGRRDLRHAMVDAANHAVLHHPHWKEQFAQLSLRLGRSKAVVAIARKLLVVVWQVLSRGVADSKANPVQVACSIFAFAHKVRVKNLPYRQSALIFTRTQLDRLKIGRDVHILPWGTKKFKLPESAMPLD